MVIVDRKPIPIYESKCHECGTVFRYKKALDQNTKRCECLRKQLREAHESYEKHLAELESQLPKHGVWIDHTQGRWIYAKCTLCGKIQDVRSKYCPNCGAKMDGKEQEDE